MEGSRWSVLRYGGGVEDEMVADARELVGRYGPWSKIGTYERLGGANRNV